MGFDAGFLTDLTISIPISILSFFSMRFNILIWVLFSFAVFIAYSSFTRISLFYFLKITILDVFMLRKRCSLSLLFVISICFDSILCWQYPCGTSFIPCSSQKSKNFAARSKTNFSSIYFAIHFISAIQEPNTSLLLALRKLDEVRVEGLNVFTMHFSRRKAISRKTSSWRCSMQLNSKLKTNLEN